MLQCSAAFPANFSQTKTSQVPKLSKQNSLLSKSAINVQTRSLEEKSFQTSFWALFHLSTFWAQFQLLQRNAVQKKKKTSEKSDAENYESLQDTRPTRLPK